MTEVAEMTDLIFVLAFCLVGILFVVVLYGQEREFSRLERKLHHLEEKIKQRQS